MAKHDLFSSKLSTISKELVREVRDSFDITICEAMYDKYKHQLPCKYSYLVHLSKEKFRELAHAAAWWLQLNTETVLGNKPEVDIGDLQNLLGTNLNAAYTHPDQLVRNPAGLKFLNAFIKEHLLAVTVSGKGPKTLKEKYKDLWFLYKVVLKTVNFGEPYTLTKLFTTSKMLDTQTVSNFRPLASAYIFNHYGVEPIAETKIKIIIDSINDEGYGLYKTEEVPEGVLDRKNVLSGEFKVGSEVTIYKPVVIIVPSEGWLGRLLSSFYLAYHNQRRALHYISIDPNPNVAETFREVVTYLKDLKILPTNNWFPVIHEIGSETEEAKFYKKGWKAQAIFTSPPYFKVEMYTNGVDFELEDGTEFRIAENKTLEVDGKHISIDNIHCGMEITYAGNTSKVVSKRKQGQSHKSKTAVGWNEAFLRPTIINMYHNLVDGGHLTLNVVNVRPHPRFEADTVSIAEEEGFKHIRTLQYMLSRVPGGAKQKDGTTISIKDLKLPYEPAFVFHKK